MGHSTDSWYRDRSDAEVLLAELSASFSNSDFDWEAILAHSYRVLLPQLFDGFSAIDIGCHLGYHVDELLALQGIRQLDCFEPQPRYFEHLTQRYKGASRVQVHDVALCDEQGRRPFVVNATAPGESGLRERSFYNDENAELTTVQVRCDRLDAWQFEKLGFIKIDTEGGEIDILKGASETVSTHRPLIALEFGIGGYDAYGYGPDDLLAIAREHDYYLTDLFFDVCKPEAFAESICSRFYWDYFLLPSEHLDTVQTMKRKGEFAGMSLPD